MHLYFAYGSNLNLPQMSRRCPGSRILSSGRLQEYRLDFTRYSSGWDCGVADVIISTGVEVWGLVFEVTDSDLDALDRYEGYPDAYTRFQAVIYTENDALEDVWVYTVREKASFIPPRKAYLEILKRTAEEHCFPRLYQEALDQIPVQDK